MFPLLWGALLDVERHIHTNKSESKKLGKSVLSIAKLIKFGYGFLPTLTYQVMKMQRSWLIEKLSNSSREKVTIY